MTNNLETEPVSCGVQDPWVVVGALHACVETKSFSRKLSGVEGARVGEGAIGLPLDITFVLPFREITKSSQLCGILHPLDNLKQRKGDNTFAFENINAYLEHGDKVDIVSVNHLGDKFNELILESLVGFDPGCTEVES